MKRIYWLDVARAVAIILVVFTHAHEQAGVDSILLKSIYYSVDRIGVPIFLMISGGMILSKLELSNNILGFYKKRIPQFIAVLCIYSLLNAAVRMSSMHGVYNLDVYDILINQNGLYPANYGAPQLWYMYTIISLYLAAPFLSRMISGMSNKNIILFCIICLLLNQVPQTLTSLGYKIDFLYRIGNSVSSAYVLYFLVGYLIIKRDAFNSSKHRGFFLYFVMFIAPIVILAAYEVSIDKFDGALHWYSSSLFIVVSSTGLMMLIKIIFEKSERALKAIGVLSSYSFGVYLSHYAFIYIIKHYMIAKGYSFNEVTMCSIYFSVGLVIGLLYTWIMIKSKYTRWLVS